MTQLNAKCQFVKDTLANTALDKVDRLNLIIGGGNSQRATNPHGEAVKGMLWAWAAYANAHKVRFEDGIGEDYVLGPEWEAIGKGIMGLLNGITGGLDCGDMDAFIRQCLTEEGFDGDNA